MRQYSYDEWFSNLLLELKNERRPLDDSEIKDLRLYVERLVKLHHNKFCKEQKKRMSVSKNKSDTIRLLRAEICKLKMEVGNARHKDKRFKELKEKMEVLREKLLKKDKPIIKKKTVFRTNIVEKNPDTALVKENERLKKENLELVADVEKLKLRFQNITHKWLNLQNDYNEYKSRSEQRLMSLGQDIQKKKDTISSLNESLNRKDEQIINLKTPLSRKLGRAITDYIWSDEPAWQPITNLFKRK